ncbi:MAG: hypothetical protein E7270_01325 [Lachnospiraceae bacterium]|nr:hypothetical protein [Lachnospiraceae bacterium]
MTKRQEFVEFVDTLITNSGMHPDLIPENVKAYLEALREDSAKDAKPEFTDNGKAILKYLQEVPKGMYKSRDIAEGMFIASKSVAGAMRKLVTDGYVEKVGKDPVVYMITEKGINVKFEGEN